MTRTYDYTVKQPGGSEKEIRAAEATVEDAHLLLYDEAGTLTAGFRPGEWKEFEAEEVGE